MVDYTLIYIIGFVVFGHILFGIGWLVWKMNKPKKDDTKE